MYGVRVLKVLVIKLMPAILRLSRSTLSEPMGDDASPETPLHGRKWWFGLNTIEYHQVNRYGGREPILLSAATVFLCLTRSLAGVG
jgi:hypothetical protein